MHLRTIQLSAVMGIGLLLFTACFTTQPQQTGGAAPGAATAPTQPAQTGAPKKYSSAPAMTIDKAKKYQAVLATTEGTITIDLLAQDAPTTVNNFVFLAKDRYYDGVKFHRILKGFMIQGGDPSGDGTGGPGYRFPDEPVKLDYKPGIVAMANAGPNTNGSQFFIMHGDYTGKLPKSYTIFGQVSSGLEVVDKIANTPVGPGSSGEASKPQRDQVITSIQIKEQ